MDETESKIIRGLLAKVEMLEDRLKELFALLQDMSQRQKIIQYTLSKGKDETHVPKGESDSSLCQICGRRVMRTEVLKKAKDVSGNIVIYECCKACFYSNN